MFSVIRTPHPSTGIEHSIQARFFGPWEDNLLVAGTDNLRVFRLVPDLEGQMALADRPKMKLECMASYQLFGEVMGLQKVSLPGSIRQRKLNCLIIFECKVSLCGPTNRKVLARSLLIILEHLVFLSRKLRVKLAVINFLPKRF